MSTIDNLVSDFGPEIDENLISNPENPDELIQTMIEPEQVEMLQVDRMQQAINIDWPKASSLPINEFQFDGLATLTFPCLFPFGLGDPTMKIRFQTVTETEGFKHLLKYAVKKSCSNDYHYPFASHPRFKFWAYDRLRRHRALNQCKIYLKQNIGIFTIFY